ncbi:ATP-binding protein [Streptomyces sp. NPDC003691]
MIEIPELAAAGLAAGTLSAFVLGGGLLRARRTRHRQAAEIETLRTHLVVAREEADRTAARTAGACAAEVAHLAEHRLPATAARTVHPHVRVPGALRPETATGELGTALDGVLTGVCAALDRERERVDAAARAVMRGATREVQAGLYRLQDDLRALQQRYDDPELSQILYALDHENEQSLRRAQVAAVVCGAWVGLAREESHLVDAVTGGQSRIVGYHRVEIGNHLEDGTALVSHAVEPVAIIVAELLDNALRHSSPDTRVTVHLERAHHGVTVTVDDAGVGMAADERAYAQRMAAGSEPILLSELGDPPRMGLAAVGQLTRQFDLSVDLSSPSPYGGVRAVLLIKSHLLSRIDPVAHPPAASAPRSTRSAGAAEAAAQEHSGRHPLPEPGRLPVRQSRRSAAAAAADNPGDPATPADRAAAGVPDAAGTPGTGLADQGPGTAAVPDSTGNPAAEPAHPAAAGTGPAARGTYPPAAPGGTGPADQRPGVPAAHDGTGNPETAAPAPRTGRAYLTDRAGTGAAPDGTGNPETTAWSGDPAAPDGAGDPGAIGPAAAGTSPGAAPATTARSGVPAAPDGTGTREANAPAGTPPPGPGTTAGHPPDDSPQPHRPEGEALPRRRRRVRTDGTTGTETAPARPRSAVRTPEEAAAALGALQAGTAAARKAAEPGALDPGAGHTEGNHPR